MRKYIFFSYLFFLFPLGLWAQEKNVDKTKETLYPSPISQKGYVKKDTFVDMPPNVVVGKSYVRFVMPVEFRTCVNCEPDTAKWIKVCTISQIPPKYDTIRTKLELCPTQVYYSLKHKSKEPISQIHVKKATITAPVYQISTQKITYSPSQAIWILEKKDANALSAHPDDCITLRRIQTNNRTCEIKTYTLQQPAQRISDENGKVENLPWDSPYLVKNVIPAVQKYKVEYIERVGPRTCIKDSVFENSMYRFQPENDTITRTVLVRNGTIKEWQEYFICERPYVISVRVKSIITQLHKKGYYKGSLKKNVFTPKIRAALSRFQKENDLQIGRLDSETLELLGVDN
jgi:Putative peptidoglycan binding domain